jgi:hypothetical protein
MNDGNGSPNVAVVGITDKLNDKVIILIGSMTDRDAVFTAFDVTKQLRIENPTMNVLNVDVKEMVLSLYNSEFCEDYGRRCIDLTVSAKAYVYYPIASSPYDHPLAVQPVVPTPTKTPPIRVSDPDSDLTVEKRLNIGKSYLDKLGLLPGKLVKVETIGSVMSLTATTDPSGSTLVVNSDGRLRLNSRMLTKAFGSLPKKYDISFNNDDFAIEVKSR